MTKRRVYDVKPTGENWAVKERGADRAVGVFPTKAEAVDRAREVGRNNAAPAQVVVRKTDMTIQTEYTYKNDPYPPKG